MQTPQTVYIKHGRRDYSNYTSLRTRFKNTTISLPDFPLQGDMKTYRFKSFCKHTLTELLPRSLIIKSCRPGMKKTFDCIGVFSLSKNTNCLKDMAKNDLFWAYFKAHHLPRNKRKFLRACISHILRTQHNVPSITSLILKLPQNYYHHKSISRLAHSTINDAKLEPFIKSYLHKHLRVVMTKRPSVYDILSNHIKVSKSLSYDTPPECTCDHLEDTLGLSKIDTSSTSGHYMKRFTTLCKPYKSFRCNLKNTPPPQHIDANMELNKAFHIFSNTLSRFGKTPPLSRRLIGKFIRKNFNGIEFSGQIVSSTFESFTGKHIYRVIYHDSDSEDLYFSEIKPLLSDGIPSIDKQNNSQDTNFDFGSLVRTNTHNFSSTPSIAAIKHFKHTLSGSVISTYDKNLGCGNVCCPIHFWHATKQMFNDDKEHYITTSYSPDLIKRNFHAFYRMNNLHKVQTFDTTKTIPYSYILFKNKDDNRRRPIVSYYNHPLKKSFNYTSRALSFILKHASLDAFTLWRTRDCSSTCNTFSNELGITFGNDTGLIPYCADIKNMYTEIPHDILLKSIKFALQRFKSITGKTTIILERKKRGEISSDLNVFASQSTHVKLTLTQIFKIAKYDIENSYFTSCNHTLRQIKGVPMGSPGSPNYAICFCMYHEHLFSRSLHNYTYLGSTYDVRRLFRATRYVDDVLGFVSYDKRLPFTHDLAKHIIDSYSKSYHDAVTLKPEDVSQPFPYLEGTTSIKSNTHMADTIHISYNNKNYKNLLKHNELKTLTLKHRHSFMTKHEASAKMIGQIHRIKSTALTKPLRFLALCEFGVISTFLGYSLHSLYSALTHVANSTHDDSWLSLRRKLRRHFATHHHY